MLKHYIYHILILLIFFSLSSVTQANIIETNNTDDLTNEFNQKFKTILKFKYLNLPDQPNRINLSQFKLIKELYTQNNYQLIWSHNNSLNSKNISELSDFISNLDKDGLKASDYHHPILLNLKKMGASKKLDVSTLIKYDILLSEILLDLSLDINVGRISAKKVYKDWFYKKKSFEALSFLVNTLQRGQIKKQLTQLFPNTVAYQKMRETLKYYKELKKQGEWTKLPKEGKKWIKGDTGPHIAALKSRLRRTGELTQKKSTDENLFDEELEIAVKKYQKQHGLNEDGVVGIYTWQGLNLSINDRILQLKTNMERYRWLPQSLGERHIFVNIPDYKIRVVEKGKTKLTLRGVVGNTKWRTPVFQDEMEFLVLNPRWNVPPKITKKETLPKIQKDPSYIEKMNFKVFKKENGKRVVIDPKSVDWSQAQSSDYFFSQKSGSGNALGRIKFMFPNKYSIYIHDTPSKYLFKRDVRAYSHGCIRLENPLELAENLLEKIEKPQWDMSRLKKVIGTNQLKSVKLPKKVPIHLYYLTAWADEFGQMQYRKDIYGYDKKLARALKL
ncbi:hypothetical protein BVY03_03960 [bacterium K02(2017)]|nr:hypothetical protein BVY03_03960 [bacterium K02(2017)]